MNTQKSTPSNDAPKPGGDERPEEAEARSVTGKQWIAICCVVCLLVALFLFMHGGEF